MATITLSTAVGNSMLAYPSGTIASKAMTFDAITSDASADDTGTCTWARFATGAGAAVVDVDASTIGGAGFLQMNTTSIVAGGPISAASCVISI